MRNFCIKFLSLVFLLLCSLPIASQAEVLDSEQLAKRLTELRLEYNRIDTDITRMSRFMDSVKEERASIDTLAKFLYRLPVVAKEIENLSRKAEALSLKGKALAISRMWATDTLKSSEALAVIPEGEAAYLYLNFDMPTQSETVDMVFTVTDLKSGEKVVALNRTRPRKGEKNTQRTGIKIETGDLQLGASYEWQVELIADNGKTISEKLRFDYGQPLIPLEAITLTASQGDTGQPLDTDITDDLSMKFEAKVPLIEAGEGEITWQLIGPDKHPVESAKKVESFSETGGSKTSHFELQSQVLPPGQYAVSVTHVLKGNSKSKTEAAFTFNVLGAVTVHKLAVSNTKKGDITSGTLKAGDLPHLFVHYTALKPVKMGSLRIYDAKSGKDYYTSDITQRVKVDRQPHRIGTRLGADVLPLDREVVFEVRFNDMNGNEIADKRAFRINRHKLNVKLVKQLKSGKDYQFSITPPAGFISPYSVKHTPQNLLVHESRNDPLKGYVTGITEEKEKSAGLKIELTDANGQVAVAYRKLVVMGLVQKQPMKQPGAITTQKSVSGDLFASLWGYREGDYLNDPIIKQLDDRYRKEFGGAYNFDNCLPVIARHGEDSDIDSDRLLMGKLKTLRKKITKRKTKCSNGEPYYKMKFSLQWNDFPQKPISGYKDYSISYGAGCRPAKGREHQHRYVEYDGGYYAEFSKTFTSDDADSVMDMMVMSCLAPSRFLKKYIPEAPARAVRPMGCTSVPEDRAGFNSYSCRMPISELPRKLW
ncbi:hypothetical protein [Sedimenticola selenatireducens]|uniref:hypothetical protein n=1 Tax=Sedimenticola selenatireducens TaxID=191960 RepID=UPI002AAB9530|nr:hypothetical protein [Sedimenticola selenatireducens]